VLRAAVLPPDEAAAAWTHALELVSLDDTDPSFLDVLPRVWANLSRHGPELQERPRLTGIYRRWWYLQQRTTTALREATSILTASALEATTSADAATEAASGHRRLVVAPRDLAPAIATLRRESWCVPRVATGPTPWRRIHWASNPGGVGIELAASPARLLIDERDPDGSWKWFRPALQPGEIAGQPILRLSTSDTFVAACCDGLGPTPSPSLAWLVVAAALIDVVDHDRVLATSDRFSVRPQVVAAVDMLADQLGVVAARPLRSAMHDAPPATTAHEARVRRSWNGRGAALWTSWQASRRWWPWWRQLLEVAPFAVEHLRYRPAAPVREPEPTL
jgi:hypothetical protein